MLVGIFFLFVNISSAQIQTGIQGDIGVNFEKKEITNYSVINTNSSDYWDDLDTYNSTQMENSNGILTILTSWINGLWCSVFGCQMEGDIDLGGNKIYNGSAEVNLSGSYGYSLQDAYNSGNIIYEGLPLYLYDGRIDFGFINVESPKNATYCSTTVEFNVSLDEDGDTCRYKLENDLVFTTMTKFNNTYFNYTKVVSQGSHYIFFRCNDTSGNLYNTSLIYFNVDTSANCGSKGYIFDSIIAEGRICDSTGCIGFTLQDAYEENGIIYTQIQDGNLSINVGPSSGDIGFGEENFIITQGGQIIFRINQCSDDGRSCLYAGGAPPGIESAGWLPLTDNVVDLGFVGIWPDRPMSRRWRNLYLSGKLIGCDAYGNCDGASQIDFSTGGNVFMQGNITSNGTMFARNFTIIEGSELKGTSTVGVETYSISAETGSASYSNITINNSLCDARTGNCNWFTYQGVMMGGANVQ